VHKHQFASAVSDLIALKGQNAKNISRRKTTTNKIETLERNLLLGCQIFLGACYQNRKKCTK
jgi:hypothetical protein